MPPLHNILFLDIETVPQYPDYNALPAEWKDLWDLKSNLLLRNQNGDTNETIYPRAGIYAEFGKVICISCGLLQNAGGSRKLVVKSFFGENEPQILSEFCDMLRRWTQGEQKYLCAHNGKEFDFPFLCRRMIINNVCLPQLLNISGRRPWEIPHFDTMELWKFGDHKNYTSLNLLAHSLGIPTPKDDIDGSMVWSVYWKDRDLQRIVNYCQKDVVTVAQIFLRLHSEQPVSEVEMK